ncbi:MAG TPA: IS630 family transposase, partial [Candidatus Krumholzibacteria bacterium]
MIPPDCDGEFVARMENLLDLYAEPFDASRPVICMDETSKQLIGEVTLPLPRTRGRAKRVDYEYRRNGTINVFVFVQPRGGWRMVRVTDHRTRIDWALAVRELLDVHFPGDGIVRLVMDNLNTHSLGSLYEAFDPTEARRLARRLDIHHTPKHASWLNAAENEISVLSAQCLDRRIEDPGDLKREIAAWERERNKNGVEIDWKFSVE